MPVYLAGYGIQMTDSDGVLALRRVDSGAVVRNYVALNEGSIVMNEDSIDVDFIVESDNVSDCLKVDAGTDAVNVAGRFAYPYDSTIVLSAGNNNNLNPSGWSRATNILIEASKDGDANITGLSGGTSNRIAIFQVKSEASNSVYIIPYSSSSSGANQFHLSDLQAPNALELGSGDTATFIYSTNDNKWHLLSHTGAFRTF